MKIEGDCVEKWTRDHGCDVKSMSPVADKPTEVLSLEGDSQVGQVTLTADICIIQDRKAILHIH